MGETLFCFEEFASLQARSQGSWGEKANRDLKFTKGTAVVTGPT